MKKLILAILLTAPTIWVTQPNNVVGRTQEWTKQDTDRLWNALTVEENFNRHQERMQPKKQEDNPFDGIKNDWDREDWYRIPRNKE